MKKVIASVVILTALMSHCSSMEQKATPKSEDGADVFFQIIAENLLFYKSAHSNCTDPLEIIQISSCENKPLLIKQALVINNITKKDQTIHLFMLTPEAHQESKTPEDHWLYKISDYEEIKESTGEQTNKTGYTNKEKGHDSFEYEKSELFYEATDQFTNEIEKIKKKLQPTYRDKNCLFLESIIQTILNEDFLSQHQKNNRVEIWRLYSQGEILNLCEGALIIDKFGTAQETLSLYSVEQKTLKNHLEIFNLQLLSMDHDEPSIILQSPQFKNKTHSFKKEINEIKEKLAKLRQEPEKDNNSYPDLSEQVIDN